MLPPTVPLPLTDPAPVADPRMFTSAPSFVEIEMEDDPLPVSMVASVPVLPCSLQPASANAAAKIISSFFIKLYSHSPATDALNLYPASPRDNEG